MHHLTMFDYTIGRKAELAFLMSEANAIANSRDSARALDRKKTL